jgi:arginine decarboxylase
VPLSITESPSPTGVPNAATTAIDGTEATAWTAADGAALYGIDRWGEPYFSVSSRGHVTVQPRGERGGSLDLVELVRGLQDRNLSLPLIIRFDDILEDRLERLHAAFERAIAQYGYAGRYQGVFPVKCNQQCHLVEQLVESGHRWHFGLEAGSKAELLIALSLLDDPQALLICNGYKDRRYIETAILARRLGRQPVVVIEQADEVERIIKASRQLGAAPFIGIRAKLSSRSSGRWGSSVGERAKFGLSIPDLLGCVQDLSKAGLLADLRLLHFHIGSQISDIAVLKDALQEAGQIYVELTRLGAPMGFLDVGGGLGIDYDGSRTATAASTNYSLQNYANDVVATVRECCEPHAIPLPTLVSESGRAIASHCSVLVFDVLGSARPPGDIPPPAEGEPLMVRNLRDTLELIKPASSSEQLQEAWNDAIKFKDDALAAFRLGYLGLPERAMAEQLYWACCQAIAHHVQTPATESSIPDDLKSLEASLASTYYANLSVFRSAPDTWAIDQLFPVLPIHRLDERPTGLGDLADLTCDSDGRISRFIDKGQAKTLLELHQIRPGEPYWMGLFLAGAYQEVMGNLHNLFGSTNAAHIRLAAGGGYVVEHVIRGDTNAEVLQMMEHDPRLLLERIRRASENAISRGDLRLAEARLLMAHLEASLGQSTYLQDGNGAAEDPTLPSA